MSSQAEQKKATEEVKKADEVKETDKAEGEVEAMETSEDQKEEKKDSKSEEVENGTPKSSPAKKDADLVKAMNLLAAGKRNLLVADVSAAVNSLEQSCRLLGDIYGETATQCGEAFYYYGKSLLELARIENGVLENVLDGVPSEDEPEANEDSKIEDPEKCSEKEKEEVSDQVGEALEENFKNLEKAKNKNGIDAATDTADVEMEVALGGEDEEKMEDQDTSAKDDKAEDEAKPSPKTEESGASESKDSEKKSEDMASPIKTGKSEDLKGDASPGKADKSEEANGKTSPDKAEDAKDKVSPDVADKSEDLKDKTSPEKANKSEDSKASSKEADKSEDSKDKASPEKAVKSEDSKDKASSAKADKSEDSKASPDESGEAKKTDESEENSEAEEEKKGEDSAAEGEGEGEGEDDDKKEGEGENESIASNEAGTSDAKEVEDKSQIENEDEEDPSNLQLAWEMLELAKNCYKKQCDALGDEDEKRVEAENMLSEIYMVLGEVSIENENYPQAIEDLTTCLRRRQEFLPSDSRIIAETHYKMGVAEGFNMQFDDALQSLEAAIAVLTKRIELLGEKKESPDPAKVEDAFHTREKEIEELNGLIPEIREKITDTMELKAETHKKLGDRVMAEEKELEAISPAVSSGKGKSTNGIGVKNGGGSGDPEAKSNGNGVASIAVKKRKKEENDQSASKKLKEENPPAAANEGKA